jgi:hypothetical protein
MNWNDPAERLALSERVGAYKYNRQFEAHQTAITVATINGHQSGRCKRASAFCMQAAERIGRLPPRESRSI